MLRILLQRTGATSTLTALAKTFRIAILSRRCTSDACVRSSIRWDRLPAVLSLFLRKGESITAVTFDMSGAGLPRDTAVIALRDRATLLCDRQQFTIRVIAAAHPVAPNAGLAGHFDSIYDHVWEYKRKGRPTNVIAERSAADHSKVLWVEW